MNHIFKKIVRGGGRLSGVVFLVALLFAGFLSAGCCRRLHSGWQRGDSVRVERRTEYRETVRDTLIYITLPAETREVVGRDSSLLQTSTAESFARIEPDGSLFHTLRNRQAAIGTTVPVRHAETVERSDSIRVEYVRETETVRERYVPPLYRLCLYIVLALIGWGILKSGRRLGS